jgi:ABC-type Zn uptake system ZnuABC Zn-binding protein ZnuA
LAKLKPFAGTKVVTYHRSFDYLLRRFGFELDGTLEPKPGIEPSPAHINDLTARMKADGVKLVVIEPFRPRKTAEQLAAATGAKLVVLPDKSGADDKAATYPQLFNRQVALLAEALGKTP